MESLKIKLDNSHYKGLIFGTGLTESLISAALAYKGFSSINFDLDDSYSAAVKTCSVKEFIKLFTQVYPAHKNHIFRVVDFESTVELGPKANSLRGFNIDLQPRFLYSSSLTVNKMVEAGMDKYMDFRAISGVYFFDVDSNKFIKMPINKGEIFASGALSILEKRKLFKFLHISTSISKILNDSDINVNSTSEFDKDMKIDEELMKKIIAIKNEHFGKFLELMDISGKLANLLLFVIGNYLYSIEDSKGEEHFLSTHAFLTRIEKFISSMGVHSNYPYLYTNYGTSDIPQGFSRTSAVNGSIFILNPELDLQEVVCGEGEDAEGNKYTAKMRTSMAGEKEFITTQTTLLNRDFVHLIQGFEEKDLGLETKALLRVTIIVEDVEKTLEADNLSFYYVFPKTKGLDNPSPMFIFNTGEKSSSAPDGYVIFYVQTVVDSNMGQEELKKLEEKIREFVRVNMCQNAVCVELMHASYLQVRRKLLKDVEKEKFVVIEDDDFAIDFDDYFKRSAEYMKKLTPENGDLLFYHNGDVKPAPAFGGTNDEDEEGGSYFKGLLETLDRLKVKEEVKTDEPETTKGNEEETQAGEAEEKKEEKTEEKSEETQKVEEPQPVENQEKNEGQESAKEGEPVQDS